MAGESKRRAWVAVGPPLNASGPSLGSAPMMLPVVLPLIVHPVLTRMRLLPWEVMVPPQSPPVAPNVLLATIESLRFVVSLAPRPPERLQALAVMVVLVTVRVPEALRMPPPLTRQEFALIVLLFTDIVPPAVLRMPPAKERLHSDAT